MSGGHIGRASHGAKAEVFPGVDVGGGNRDNQRLGSNNGDCLGRSNLADISPSAMGTYFRWEDYPVRILEYSIFMWAHQWCFVN